MSIHGVVQNVNSSGQFQLKKNQIARKGKRVFIHALLIRVILLVVVLLSIKLGLLDTGFVSSSTINDDVRYETGARIYSMTAKSVYDIDALTAAFASLGDQTGYSMQGKGVFDSTPLWYVLICVLSYCTKTTISIRILNILLSSASCVLLYKITLVLYNDEKASKLAANLLAFLPYPAIFSCFCYKDHLVLFNTLYMLHMAVKYRYIGKSTIAEWILFGINTLSFILLRSGVSVAFLCLCLFLSLQERPSIEARTFKKRRFMKLLLISVLVVFGFMYFNEIISKIGRSASRTVASTSEGYLSLFAIDRLTDIWKLPFSFLYTVVSPLGSQSRIENWGGIVKFLNMFTTPVAIGAAFYIVKKKKDKLLFWMCCLYYSMFILTALGVFRHYYSVMPLSYIVFARFWSLAGRTEKTMVALSSSALSVVLLAIYVF